MYGFHGIPPSSSADVQIFQGATSSAILYQTWLKPSTAGFIYVMAVSGGSGGGAGCSGSAGTRRDGGGGGGGAQTVAVWGPAILFPKHMCIQIGLGGAGGAADVAAGFPGAVGQNTTLYYPDINAATILSAGHPGGGGGGTSDAGGSGGAAPGTAVATNWLENFLTFTSGNGGSGGTGGSNSSGTGAASALAFSGGGGGGSVTSSNVFQVGGPGRGPDGFLTAQPAGGQADGAAGERGITIWTPLIGCGGGGGASSTTNGGAGGKGGIGAGGGGGGGGVTAGAGGNGGDGIVIIVTI